MKLLEGKKALIFGVANDRSIAWGIAQEFKRHGAQIALSYANDALKKRVEPLAEEVGADFTFEMDVTNDEHYEGLESKIKEHWEDFDILVHSIAFADRQDLKGQFVDTSRKGFQLACDVSAFSLVGLSQRLQGMMNDEGSVLAMTYYGSQKVVQNYNVMGVAKAALESSTRYLAEDLGQKGIRVNCISAGPIKTLAASGISVFRTLLSQVEEKAPLKRNVTQEDVGGNAVYLASDLSKGVTGQVLYVDSGLSVLGGF
ncbi:MAG: enoyl-[acyl-carrier-protein] reductase FabI [Halobacteriovoraceae bacterium]|nr:enoyl-[acyl-carrier-protein] reductase FabI [Halobacteriovoraceae bacterium]